MKAESLSLSQLNLKIKSALQSAFSDQIWVVAEISELRLNSSGHCYLELIEKDADSDSILAKIKATIWSYTFRMLSPYFETTTGYRLSAGLKVLIRVQPDFHEVYGISLIIKDIDPSYTLGDLARKRQEILRKLKADGVIDMNKMVPFPMVPQRIAVISSETAAGYGDFMDTLVQNPQGFHFLTELFSAQVQGEKASESIINALERIYDRENDFDVVVIIRGGGAQSELDCFNNYDLVYHITQFPLPVISGIGHERDETITDLVAHTSVKTPTAVAEFLIGAFNEFEGLIDSYREQLVLLAGDIISGEKEKILQLSQNMIYLIHEILNEERSQLATSFKRLGLNARQYSRRKNDFLESYSRRISFGGDRFLRTESGDLSNTAERLKRSLVLAIKSENDKLAVIEKTIDYLNPEQVLKRGYSIASSGGKLIKDSTKLKKGDILTTKFYNGKAISIIEKTEK